MPISKENRDKVESLDPREVLDGISGIWRHRGDKQFKPSLADLICFENQLAQKNDASIVAAGLPVCEWLRSHRESCIGEFFWSPFDKQAAFLGVSDAEIRKDSQWMLELTRRVRDPRFLWVQAGNDHCTPPDLAAYSAICQIGRDHPSYPTSDLLPKDKSGSRLRFSFPPLPQRGVSLSPEDHRVLQSWRGKVYQSYRTVEIEKAGPRGQHHERTDWAVVQRFRVPYRGAEIAVVVLAGPSSLATAGAIMFATEMFSHPEKFDRYQGDAGKMGALSPSSQIEVLLKVTGGVHTPRIPWEPKWEVEKFFINNSPNLVQKPSTIWTYPELRFDEDVIDLKEDSAAVVALCRAAKKNRRVQLRDLVKDKSVWPDGQLRWNSAGSALADYREMQKGALRGIFAFSKGDKKDEDPLAELLGETRIDPEQPSA